METDMKKPYEKPMLVFENFETGELTGSPEMIGRIRADQERYRAEDSRTDCPFDPLPCPIR